MIYGTYNCVIEVLLVHSGALMVLDTSLVSRSRGGMSYSMPHPVSAPVLV